MSELICDFGVGMLKWKMIANMMYKGSYYGCKCTKSFIYTVNDNA
jgi:hypothetical protein